MNVASGGRWGDVYMAITIALPMSMSMPRERRNCNILPLYRFSRNWNTLPHQLKAQVPLFL